MSRKIEASLEQFTLINSKIVHLLARIATLGKFIKVDILKKVCYKINLYSSY